MKKKVNISEVLIKIIAQSAHRGVERKIQFKNIETFELQLNFSRQIEVSLDNYAAPFAN